jgi:phosphate:Na+ symporter
MVQDLFVRFGDNPLLAILAAAIFTMIVQSSSATVAITMALATTGLLDFRACVALILGDNIGTTITAWLASLGGNVCAKRTARAHILFNVLGVAWVLALLPAYVRFVDFVTPGEGDLVVQTAEQAAYYSMAIGEKPFIARHIANAHTIFNVVNTLVFLPLLPVLVRFATLLVPDKDKEVALDFHLKYLDTKVLDAPDIALEQARLEVKRMAEVTDGMLRRSWEYFGTGEESLYNRIVQEEQLVDLLQKEITDFLTTLSQQSISAKSSKEIADMLHIAADLERVADHAENLAKLTCRMQKNKVEFTGEATHEIQDIYTTTQEFLSLVASNMMSRNGDILPQARTYEEKVNQLEDDLRDQHIRRLQEGTCQVESGLIYIDMLTNLEKIGDHSFNIAEFLAGAR